MAQFFAQRVILGKTKFEDVPKILKSSVEDILKNLELYELITE